MNYSKRLEDQSSIRAIWELYQGAHVLFCGKGLSQLVRVKRVSAECTAAISIIPASPTSETTKEEGTERHQEPEVREDH